MDDKEFRQLQEEAALISEVAAHPGWRLLASRMDERMRKIQLRMIQGRCEDFIDYQRECAFLTGVTEVMDVPRQVKEQLDREILRRKEEDA